VELTDPWYGNPDLKKESRSGFDIGIVQELLEKRIKFELTYFQTRIVDNIGYDFNTFRMENFDTYAEGLELYTGIAPVEGFTVDVGYTHVATRNLKNHTPLAGRSPNFGSVRISRRAGAFTATLTGYFSEKVPPEGILDEKGLPQKNTGKAELVNAVVIYNMKETTRLIFKVTNLLDRRFKESERAPKTPGIGVFAGISMEF
jgi:vitamin B12 transporter